MGLSNYQAFMECMRKWEKIGCNILCGLALGSRCRIVTGAVFPTQILTLKRFRRM